MPFYYYGYDLSYLIFVLPAVIFALWAQFHVNSTIRRYQKIRNSRGMTGCAAARAILDANGLQNISVEHISGNLTDHYDPRANVIRLSDAVYNSDSATAVGIAAHEAGHAIQHAQGYMPIKIRQAIIPVTSICSNLSMPLILLGLLFSFPSLAYIGVILFGASTVFQLVTLPVEFNASARAIRVLDEYHYLEDDELRAAKKTLSAAALTYVAALAVSLANLLRLFLLVNRSKRK